MNFKKDLLLIDLETTGLDPKRHEIIQLAAVLLDKKTLKEKKHFNTYCKPTRWKNRDLESMAVNRIQYEQVKNAPSMPQVLKNFAQTFDLADVIFSYYVGVTDVVFMKAAYEKARVRFPFDYHTFNIWGVFYPFLAMHNKLDSKKDFAGFGMESLMKHFKIEVPTALHDALVDCRSEAEVLRQVMAALKK